MLLLFVLLFVAHFLSGCATVQTAPSQSSASPQRQGIYHKVSQGETLWRIAKMYNVTVEELVFSNKIPDAANIEKNQLLFIPQAVSQPQTSAATVETKGSPTAADFDWPIKGKIIAYFGQQNDSRINNGIDIESDAGSKVVAACDGRVVFADDLNGYGKTVIIDHAGQFLTVYAQNSTLLVKLDDLVKKGMPISQVGRNNRLAFLHFEIRKNDVATNPLYYLP